MINKVILVGNLGAAPEIRYTASATAVANIRLATSRAVKNKATGEWGQETEWHSVVAWGKTAEFVGKYLHKGSRIYVEGRLQTRSWQDKTGEKRYTTEVVSEILRNLSPKEESHPGGNPGPPLADPPLDDGTGDDVPF